MALRGWSWEAAIGPAGLGDRPLLEALEAAIPDEAVEATIDATGTRERRRRLLPTHLVVTLVVAMGLWASEAMRHVLAEVVAGGGRGVRTGRPAGTCRAPPRSCRPGSGPGHVCSGSCSRRWPGRSPRRRLLAHSWVGCG